MRERDDERERDDQELKKIDIYIVGRKREKKVESKSRQSFLVQIDTPDTTTM